MTSRLTVFGAAGASGSSDHWISASSVNALGTGGTVDASGNVYVCGNTNTSLTTLLTKQNKSGIYQFQKRIANNSSSVAPSLKSVFVDASNIYCGGYIGVNVNSSSYGVPHIVKYDLSGSVVWQRKIDVLYGADEMCLCKDSSANLYTTCYLFGTYNLSYLFKHNSSGTLQWQYTLPTNVYIAHSTTDSAGNLYVAGSTHHSTGGLGLLIKLNSSGAIQWQRTLQISGQHLLTRSVKTDSLGNVYVTGTYTNNIYVAKYNSSGTLQWQKTINVSASRLSSFIDNNDNLYIASGVFSPYEARVLKFNSSGTLQWQRRLGASSILQSNIFADSSGNYYIVAQKYGANPFTYLSKLPADGSKTGTYGSYVYDATTYTISDGSMTTGTPTYTTTASSVAESANTTSQSNAAFTNTLTYI